jgi:hypothetical protein
LYPGGYFVRNIYTNHLYPWDKEYYPGGIPELNPLYPWEYVIRNAYRNWIYFVDGVHMVRNNRDAVEQVKRTMD